MKLVDVYSGHDLDLSGDCFDYEASYPGSYSYNVMVLYRLLEERAPWVNISHKEMPTLKAHADFVSDEPYKHWYLIELGDDQIGAIYLTHANEIGVQIFERYQGNGYGRRAIEMLMAMCGPGRYLANIAPHNHMSQRMFENLGFGCIQYTFEKVVGDAD